MFGQAVKQMFLADTLGYEADTESRFGLLTSYEPLKVPQIGDTIQFAERPSQYAEPLTVSAAKSSPVATSR